MFAKSIQNPRGAEDALTPSDFRSTVQVTEFFRPMDRKLPQPRVQPGARAGGPRTERDCEGGQGFAE